MARRLRRFRSHEAVRSRWYETLERERITVWYTAPVLANTRPRRITADDVEPLELLVTQLAATIANASPQPSR